MEFKRETPTRRPVEERVHDWLEVYEDFPVEKLKAQAARCMDCAIPFCHQGCPLGNIIPDWNDLVYREQWRMAIDRLHATNNFPEFTGRLCPAPCEAACVLGINDDPVTIKQVELSIIERAFDEGWVKPEPPEKLTGRSVAIVGSGPAGLACAQQLARAGHAVTVFERADRIGGLLRYGIPDFKMEKRHLDRRVAQMEAEGVVFRPGVNVGVDLPADRLLAEFDAVCLCDRAPQNPWPQWSNIFRTSTAHEEGDVREYSINTRRFVGEGGRVTALEAVRVEMKTENGRPSFVEVPGTEQVYPADLVLLAMGFVGPERRGLLEALGVAIDRN